MSETNNTKRLSISSYEDLFNQLVGPPDKYRYKLPYDAEVLRCIEDFLNREILEIATGIEAMTAFCTEAHCGYELLGGDEPFLPEHTQELIHFIGRLSRQIKHFHAIKSRVSGCSPLGEGVEND